MPYLPSPKMRTAIFFWAIMLFAFSSCTRDTYVLNTPNPTLFEKKGDKELNLHINGKSLQPQWGMAVGNHLAYQVNGHIGFLGQSYLEGIGGYYLHYEDLFLETYTGLGYGYLNYQNGSSSGLYTWEDIDVNTEYLKVPLKLNIGARAGENGRLFMVHRVSYVHYSHFDYYYKTTKEDGVDGYHNVTTTLTADVPSAEGFIWDFGVGLKTHNCMFQLGGSYTEMLVSHHEVQAQPKINQVNYDKYKNEKPFYTPFYFTFGYSFDFKKKDRRYREREPEKPSKWKTNMPRFNGEDIQ